MQTQQDANTVYYPPQNPPPYSLPGQQPHVVETTVVQVSAVPMIQGARVGTKPTVITCRACHSEIITRVSFIPSLRTHLMAALLCLIGCWPCVCLPYCVESCNNIDHYCPNCNAYIGTYRN